MAIHPTAIVSPDAQIGKNVCVGPYCVIEPNSSIGDGTRLASHVVIKCDTHIGGGNQIESGAILGGRPQHLAAAEKVGMTRIGDHNQIRENTTIHAALDAAHQTVVGHRNMLMVGSHVGHDCVLGNHNILANNVMLAGHVEVADRVYFGGAAAVHQFCRVGSYAMVGGMARVTKDVPPFVMVDGDSTTMVGLNKVGLRRAGMGPAELNQLKEAYRIAFRGDDVFAERLVQLQRQFSSDIVQVLIRFLQQGKRGFLCDRSSTRRAEPGRWPQLQTFAHPALKRAA